MNWLKNWLSSWAVGWFGTTTLPETQIDRTADYDSVASLVYAVCDLKTGRYDHSVNTVLYLSSAPRGVYDSAVSSIPYVVGHEPDYISNANMPMRNAVLANGNYLSYLLQYRASACNDAAYVSQNQPVYYEVLE